MYNTKPSATGARVCTKFPGGAELQKELQGFAGVVSFQNGCFRNGTAMLKTTQERTVSEHYFGNPIDPDSVGICKQLVEGAGIFAHIYDTEEMSQQTSSQHISSNNRNNVTLILKPFLHCLPDTKVVVGPLLNNINMQLLVSSGLVTARSKNATPIKAKTLLSRAQAHIKNGKKALAVVLNRRSPYKMYASTGNLPSGMTMDDYYVYVRKRMFVLLTSKEALAKGTQIPPFVIGADTLALAVPASLSGVEDDDVISTTTASFASCSAGTNLEEGSTTDNSITNNTTGTDDDDEDPAVEQDEEIDDDDDDGGDFMPDDWSFPGFIAFAMLGPIVPPAMVPYRTELFMTKLQPIPVGDTSNGRAAMRRMEKDIKMSTAGVATVVVVKEEEHVSTQHKIMIAGIAQSKVLIEQRQQFKLNDQVTLLHNKKVSAVRMLINEQRYMISILLESDPDRIKAIHELKALNQDLKNALVDSIAAEEAIVNSNFAYTQTSKAANAFIDLTVASVLGGDEDCTPTHSTLNKGSSTAPAAMTTTPQTSNKKAKRYHHSSDFALSTLSPACSLTSISAADAPAAAFSTPRWSLNSRRGSVSPLVGVDHGFGTGRGHDDDL
jgi:hypothetical protein